MLQFEFYANSKTCETVGERSAKYLKLLISYFFTLDKGPKKRNWAINEVVVT